MDGLSLALAGPGLVVLLVQSVQAIREKIREGERFKELVQELQAFGLDDNQAQLDIDIALAQKVMKDSSIEIAHKDRLDRSFKRITLLVRTMEELVAAISTQTGLKAILTTRHAAKSDLKDLGRTKKLNTSIADFHTTVMSLREVAKDESPLFLEDRDFVITDIQDHLGPLDQGTFFAKGRLSQTRDSIPSNVELFVLETKPYEQHTKDSVKKDLRVLAQKLSGSQARSGILPIVGFRDEFDGQAGAFQLVFHVQDPQYAKSLVTLKALYSEELPMPSLNYRVELCHQLSESILQIQTIDLVHKNVRPENIILSRDGALLSAMARPKEHLFLKGWQYARHVDPNNSRTYLRPETTVPRRIYQHPERQLLPQSEARYCMGHDVYSLGVCMLEILTWTPLLVEPEEGLEIDRPALSLSPSYIQAYKQLGHASQDEDDVQVLTKFPTKIQETLIEMAKTLVPAAAGLKMSGMIVRCLKCLDDDGEEDYYIETKDRDKKAVSMHFVDGVLADIRNFLGVL